jgi:hypothetical protein
MAFENRTSGDKMTTISDLYLTSVILRTCIGLLLCSLSLTTQATQPESPQLDVFAVHLTYVDTSKQSSYRFNTTVASTTPNNLVFSNTSRQPAFSEFKNGTSWITSIRWHLTSDGDHASLSPQLRLESKESRIEIRPLQRSVWMIWRRALP